MDASSEAADPLRPKGLTDGLLESRCSNSKLPALSDKRYKYSVAQQLRARCPYLPCMDSKAGAGQVAQERPQAATTVTTARNTNVTRLTLFQRSV